jgi:hypothetical protein
MSAKGPTWPGSAVAIAMLATSLAAELRARPILAQESPLPAVMVDKDDISGVVTSRFGPEAGVWVIAETADLGTRYAKMVVTDERGRFVIPDLPKASYRVWVRGYGLVASAKTVSEPGKVLNLTAQVAPALAVAAHIIRRSTGLR